MPKKTDDIYAERLRQVGRFVFDEQVANVFDDMINRSVPGYASIISAIGLLAASHVQAGTRCYDLGCSLGAATVAMRDNIPFDDCEIVAIDNAPAMVAACQRQVNETAGVTIDVRCADVTDVEIDNASLVVLNFTLQFIDSDARDAVISTIYNGLVPGGILVLSEKLHFDDADIAALQSEMHTLFKRANGYSELEISQKRTALENVLIPESLGDHKARLARSGFEHCELWFQCFNFASLVAIK